MNERPQVDFQRLIAAEGIPTTETALALELEKEVEAAGSKVSNDSRMSPFWRVINAVVIAPSLWLINNLLANYVLPNAFTATAKNIYLDLKAWEVDLDRKPATFTRGGVTFFKEKPENPVIIVAGTVIETDRIENTVYQLRVIADVLIPAGQASGLVLCDAVNAGNAFNLPAGYFSILPKSISGITHVSNPVDWITSLGANTEMDDELALRIRNQFSSVGRFHIDSIYRAMLASVAGIRTDLIYFEHDAPRGPATANAYILMAVGSTPSQLIRQLNDYVMKEGNHGHGDDLLCLVMPETQHAIQATIKAAPNLSPARQTALASDVEDMIRAAFRETADYAKVTRTLPLSIFSFSLLIKEIHQQLPDLATIKFNVDEIDNLLVTPRLTAVVIIHD
ncbi:baseplate J/gp47 family protein [Moritella sp. Urea-trap-13]|uniref:baseplate J/gp47 family protein n=1 Tax=Moritella sp. Urea-trap-13 TaxID=2058327 RepID=UPI000C34CBAF|nr:baseplate J/gp47 family protein [Moritella sp. Urea-trap-13]PKH06658.1 hypothetical protein CXF93_12230 [Moritella sp. Urea-trap-13]